MLPQSCFIATVNVVNEVYYNYVKELCVDTAQFECFAERYQLL